MGAQGSTLAIYIHTLERKLGHAPLRLCCRYDMGRQHQANVVVLDMRVAAVATAFTLAFAAAASAQTIHTTTNGHDDGCTGICSDGVWIPMDDADALSVLDAIPNDQFTIGGIDPVNITINPDPICSAESMVQPNNPNEDLVIRILMRDNCTTDWRNEIDMSIHRDLQGAYHFDGIDTGTMDNRYQAPKSQDLIDWEKEVGDEP